MEVKHGYKQTEVGIIPEEWLLSSLQDACRATITYGIVQCGPHIKDGVPYIRVSDMDAPELDLSEMLRTSPEIAAKFSRSTVQEGDLVYALRGKLGEVRQVRKDLAGANLTQGTARISPRDDIVGDYLLWAMRSSRMMRQAELESKGTTFREITLSDLRSISVPIPPTKHEQRAIAEALSDVDDLLGGLDRLIAKKRDLKQAAMQQLLTGQTRLPGFQREWETMRLGNIARCFSGGTPPSAVAAYYNGDILWITSGDLNQGYIRDVDGRISKAGLANSAAQIVEAGTLLIALYGATAGVTAITTIQAAINQAVLAIIPHQDSATFLYFKLRLLKDSLISTYTQGGQPNLSGDIVKSVELSIPKLPEQTAIAEVLTDMDEELRALEQRREKTRALKQGMMQELLTGRIRLVKPETAEVNA